MSVAVMEAVETPFWTFAEPFAVLGGVPLMVCGVAFRAELTEEGCFGFV